MRYSSWRLVTTALAAVFVLACLPSPAGGGDSARAPAGAVRVAKQHVTARLRVSGLTSVFSLRSRRDPRWALVNGFYQRPRPRGMWAVWVRLRAGRWTVAYAGLRARAVNPPKSANVPCDIRPAFSEPSC